VISVLMIAKRQVQLNSVSGDAKLTIWCLSAPHYLWNAVQLIDPVALSSHQESSG